MLDPKRRNELIDAAFLEQKDILLDMLETKLKEVRDKKKNKNFDRVENINETESQCEPMPKNIDVVLKAHGISAIGDTDVQLKYGADGNDTLSFDATGISNVGKVHLELGVGDGNIHIPGLDNVFTGEKLLKKSCNKNRGSEVNNNILTTSRLKPDQIVSDDQQTRRFDRSEEKLNIVLPLNETLNYVQKSENNDVHNNDNINYYNNNDSSRVFHNITTSIPIENENKTEEINSTNSLISSSAQ